MSEPKASTGQDFTNALQALCAKHANDARGDPDYFAAMITALGCATGFTIALATGGNAKGGNDMCEGVSQLIFSECTHKAPFAAFMRSAG